MADPKKVFPGIVRCIQHWDDDSRTEITTTGKPFVRPEYVHVESSVVQCATAGIPTLDKGRLLKYVMLEIEPSPRTEGGAT